MTNFSYIELKDSQAWEGLVRRTSNYSFFHCPAWSRVLQETYGFQSLFLSCSKKSEFAAIPLMTIRFPLFGEKSVCLPFSDFCGPVYTMKDMLGSLIPALLKIAGDRQWRRVELRGDYDIPPLTPSKRYVEHVISLHRGNEEVLRSMRPSTKRNILHAQKEDLRIEFCNSWEAVNSFFLLHCITRKRLGVPSQPLQFFRNIYKYLIAPGNGIVIRARFRGNLIAASVFLHFGTKAIFKYGASLPDRERVRPNNLIMWEAIKWYAERGFDSLSLGRTDPKDEGLIQFKNGWGGECRDVLYYSWPPQPNAMLESNGISQRILKSMVGQLPIPVLRLAGELTYRFMG